MEKLKFKVGDKVKILKERDGLKCAIGKTGTIIDTESYSYRNEYNVDFGKSMKDFSSGAHTYGTWWYSEDQIELFVDETLVEDFLKLKVGDLIRVNSACYPESADKRLKCLVGQIVKVVEIRPDGDLLGIEAKDIIPNGHSCNGNGQDCHCLYLYSKKHTYKNGIRLYSANLTLLNSDSNQKEENKATKKATKPIDVSELVSLMTKGFTYLAKDSDNTIFAYKKKPKMDIGGKQWYVEGYTDCKQFRGFSVGKKKLDFYWGLPVALADIIENISNYLV